MLFGQFGESEVEYLGASASADEDVGRLDVAVNYAFAMGGVERVGDLDGDIRSWSLVKGRAVSRAESGSPSSNSMAMKGWPHAR